MAWTIVYILTLPFAVWMLANLLSLLDQRPWHRPAIRLAAAICAVLILLLLTSRALWSPMAAALLTVAGLHAVSGWVFRYQLLGAGRLERRSPGREEDSQETTDSDSDSVASEADSDEDSDKEEKASR